MFNTTPEFIWAVAMAIVSAYALWRGGRTERAVAVANVVAWVATIIVQDRRNWVDPQWGMMLVDAGFLGFLLLLVVRTDRVWILPAAAFQLLALITHIGIIADPGVRAWAYMTALILWSYLVLICLAVGSYNHWRERRAGNARASFGGRQTAAPRR